MSDEYWDVIQFRETVNGKKFAIRVGSAKVTEERGFVVFLNVLPMPDVKGCTIHIKPAQTRGGAPAKTMPENRPAGAYRRGDDRDPEVPF